MGASPFGRNPPNSVSSPAHYLHCPNCNSTDLKKVSLAYQEGLFDTAARTRLRAVAVGGCVLLAAIAAG